MSSIFREVVLVWREHEYSVKPTMELLNDIEQTISISMVAYKIVNLQPPMSQIATIISKFLVAAGAKDATPEAVYMEIMAGGDTSTKQACEAIMLAAFPQLGKVEAPPAQQPKAKKRPSAK